MAVSSDGHPSSLVATVSYELPFGPGNRYLNSGLLGRIGGGWEIVFTGTYASGNALTVTTSNNLASLGYPNLRANLVPGQPIHLQTDSGPFDWTRDHWLNPAAFAAPASFTLGNTARVLDYAQGSDAKERVDVGAQANEGKREGVAGGASGVTESIQLSSLERSGHQSKRCEFRAHTRSHARAHRSAISGSRILIRGEPAT